MDATRSLSGEAQAYHESKTSLNRSMGRNSFVGFIFIVILLLALCTSTASALHDKLADRKLYEVTPPVVVGPNVNGTYPFFVRVDVENYPWCGGSLVAADVVLTAAHCQPQSGSTDTMTMTVMINGYHSSPSPNNDQELRQIEYMLPHPEYDGSTFRNDLMLLKLSDPVTSVAWVELNRDSDKPQQNEALTVMGFGAFVEGGAYPNVLQEGEVKVMNHSECRSSYGNLLGMNIIVEDTMFCAVSSSLATEACQGESGGPIINENGQQVGVVSFGDGCAWEGLPAVYARTMVRPGVSDWLGTTICGMTTANVRPEWCPTAIPPPLTADPTSSPMATSTVLPTPWSTVETANSTAAPTAEATTLATARPTTAAPSVKTSLRPTATPTAKPTLSQTATPTKPPTQRPSAKPTVAQTLKPSLRPTATPTAKPTLRPTAIPTAKPTFSPTVTPTKPPTAAPTAKATPPPTARPTTATPTARPATAATAETPTLSPTATPTKPPTQRPTAKPTAAPTMKPSLRPTATPTAKPTLLPSATPTKPPTQRPSAKPTAAPTMKPSLRPTATSTAKPSLLPSATPTKPPTQRPSAKPTAAPTMKPSWRPTATPTAKPTLRPTAIPTVKPTLSPTVTAPKPPTAAPTAKATSPPTPTWNPKADPMVNLTSSPTAILSASFVSNANSEV